MYGGGAVGQDPNQRQEPGARSQRSIRAPVHVVASYHVRVGAASARHCPVPVLPSLAHAAPNATRPPLFTHLFPLPSHPTTLVPRDIPTHSLRPPTTALLSHHGIRIRIANDHRSPFIPPPPCAASYPTPVPRHDPRARTNDHADPSPHLSHSSFHPLLSQAKKMAHRASA